MYIKQQLINNKKIIEWTILIGCIIGFLTHGFCFFNKISYHDDAFCLFTVGATFDFGRWGLGVLGQGIGKLFGGCFSIPIVNGAISVLLLSVAGALICVMLGIKERFICACVVGVIEVFPAVTSTFAYMFTAPYYMLAVLLAVLAAFLCYYSRRWKDVSLLFAIALLAFSMGIYQAYFSVTVSLLLVAILIKFWDGEKVKDIIFCGIRYVSVLAMGMLGYLLINKVFTKLLHIGLSDYAGINHMLDVSVKSILGAIGSAYAAFFEVMIQDYVGLSFFGLTRVILLFLWVITIIVLFIFSWKRLNKISEKLIYWVAVALLPLAFHIVNVMITGGDTELHTLMVFGTVFEVLFPILVVGRFLTERKYSWVLSLSVIMLIFSLAYVDNQAYFKVYLLQKETDAYYNRLITRIQETEGYQSDMPISFIGQAGQEDDSLTHMNQFSHITMTGYNMTIDDMLNDYARNQYVRWFLGFAPEYVTDTAGCQSLEEMNCYPDDGAIAIENGTVWVKLSEQ